MNKRWATLVATVLVIFTSLVITWQFRHYKAGRTEVLQSLATTFRRAQKLAGMSNIVDRSSELVPAAGSFRKLDLLLPENVRIFVTDMTGPTNYDKIGYYFHLTYYLFPREIGVSMDQPTRIAANGFLGRTSESDEEIRTNGFDVRLDSFAGHTMKMSVLRDFPPRPLVNPPWFDAWFDTVVAFLLPLLTALSGIWLLRLFFPALSDRVRLPERLACGLGLGMMAVAAITLGIRLCGFRGQGVVLFATGAGATAAMWHYRRILWSKTADSFAKRVPQPIAAIPVILGFLVFLVLFRIAGLEGLVDPDAAMAWLLKAKIIHLSSGSELVQWFSAPRLARAHLDYPTLVPALHAATYDSLGHVNDFVTKFWSVWMLFLLLAALASLNLTAKSHRQSILLFSLLGVLLLPATLSYAQMEGSTMPMIFFTVLGCGQCVVGLADQDRTRFGPGLTLLFGGAMTHFEGFIFLALAGGWLLLLPSARATLKPSAALGRLLAFWILAALPFICLRLQIPSLNYQSDWAGYALQHPGNMLLNWPAIFTIFVARMFVNPNFACWRGDAEGFHWAGKWNGWNSFYNQTTLGLAWFCLFITIVFWRVLPARRAVIVWILAMFISAAAFLSGVFTSFIPVDGLDAIINLTNDSTGGRYILPVLLAWFTALLILFFRDEAVARALPVARETVARKKANRSRREPAR